MAREGGPTYQEIKAVLSVPDRDLPQRTGVDQAAAELLAARTAFLNRASRTTWARLVAAARRLHAELGRRPSETP